MSSSSWKRLASYCTITGCICAVWRYARKAPLNWLWSLDRERPLRPVRPNWNFSAIGWLAGLRYASRRRSSCAIRCSGRSLSGPDPRRISSYTWTQMPELSDKRRRTDLDLFILALIDEGVSTPYELQKAASLSQGATIPALQRLLEARLVRQRKPGARGRTGYHVSAAGKKTLKDGWRSLIKAGPSGDSDSDLRVALLAFLGAGDSLLAAGFLRSAAEVKPEADRPKRAITSIEGSPLARWYTRLRSERAKEIQTAESRAIRSMADMLPQIIAGKSTAKRVTGKKRKRA